MERLLPRFWDKITEYPINTWAGFVRIIPFGLIIAISIHVYLILPLLDKYLGVSQSSLKNIVIYSISIFILIYLFYFTIQRLIIYINVSLSKKINIVLAYNLESVIILNEERFQRKYKTLTLNLKDYIRDYDLGNFIKIVVAPADIKLSNSSAEAKTKLGLLGSTLLVWGSIVLQKKTHFFKTKFSYEFGYSQNIPMDKARNNASKYIESFTDKRLYPSVQNRLSSFEENLFLTCLFILGFSTFTVGNFKKAKLLFESFRIGLKKSNLITQHDFLTLNAEVKRLLIRIYLFEINIFHGLSFVNKNINKIKEITDKIVTIDPDNYQVNITLALLSELERNRPLALKYNQMAENNSNPDDYSHVFNNAYFALVDGNFIRVLEIYKSIPKDGQNIHTYTSEISNFMDEKFSETKQLEFLFADGYISYMWDDEIRGKKILKNFVEKAKDIRFDVFKKEVNKILNG